MLLNYLPHIAWGNYKSKATIANCKVQAYQMFDGDAFTLGFSLNKAS